MPCRASAVKVALDGVTGESSSQQLLDPDLDFLHRQLVAGFRKNADDDAAYGAKLTPAVGMRTSRRVVSSAAFVPITTCETLEITGCKCV